MPKESELSLRDAITQFLASLPAAERQEFQQELFKFVRWCGGERDMSQLTVQDVAAYGESVLKSAADPAKKIEPVKKFLTVAKKEGWIKNSLAPHLKLKKPGNKESASVATLVAREKATLTSDGYSRLAQELESLKQERPHIAEEMRRAWADKDVRENAPLDAMRDYQGQVEARIRDLEATLKGAVVINARVSQHVALGNTVRLRDMASQEEFRYTLVHPNETDPLKGRISVVSPVGRALLDRKPGDVVEVAAPSGTVRYLIQGID
ncbi:MAG: transcription elongation factor GreA [Chloroflexi bacterium]|nr:transcription elongation factor GreA [Chloroflexota bacterium]